MNEFESITDRYDEAFIRDNLGSAEQVTTFAATFYKDVAEIYDAITRVRNVKRNPSGFSIDDAPILGLLVRAWKLLKEVIRYYEQDNAEILGMLERPLLEAVVTARYLMRGDAALLEDYRKCSYKDRLRILRELKEGSEFFNTKAGQRLVASVEEKLALEGFTENDFGQQKKNRWRLQGKSFFDIFHEVVGGHLYPSTYGMMSDSIHGSWNDSLDFDLLRNDDSTFSTYPFYQPADIRYVSPLIGLCNPAYRDWLIRIDVYEPSFAEHLDWVERVNHAVVAQFDQHFGIF
jgi:hypothetical protein